jgi:hypothetical protein
MKIDPNKIADAVVSGNLDVATAYSGMHRIIKVFTKEYYNKYMDIYIEADIYWEDLLKDAYPAFEDALNDWTHRKLSKKYSFNGFLHTSINKHFNKKLEKIKKNLTYIKAFVKTFKINPSVHMGVIVLNDELLDQLKIVINNILNMLNDDDRDLIESVYWKNESISDLSKKHKTNNYQIKKKINGILNSIRDNKEMFSMLQPFFIIYNQNKEGE